MCTPETYDDLIQTNFRACTFINNTKEQKRSVKPSKESSVKKIDTPWYFLTVPLKIEQNHTSRLSYSFFPKLTYIWLKNGGSVKKRGPGHILSYIWFIFDLYLIHIWFAYIFNWFIFQVSILIFSFQVGINLVFDWYLIIICCLLSVRTVLMSVPFGYCLSVLVYFCLVSLYSSPSP